MTSFREFVTTPGRECSVIAHRGAWGAGAPENSLEAVQRAARCGYEIVEIDVRESADGILMVHHDEDLDRMTGRRGAIEALSSAEISTLRLRDAKGGASADRTSEKIPTLDDALALAKEIGCFFDLDVKSRQLMAATAQAAATARAADLVSLKFPIESDQDLAEAQNIERETGVSVVPIQHFARRREPESMRRLAALRPFMIEARADDFQTLAAAREEVGAHGSRFWLCLLDAPIWKTGVSDTDALADPDAVWGQAIDAGADAIMTDNPDALQKYIRNRRSARASTRARSIARDVAQPHAPQP